MNLCLLCTHGELPRFYQSNSVSDEQSYKPSLKNKIESRTIVQINQKDKKNMAILGHCNEYSSLQVHHVLHVTTRPLRVGM